MPCRVRLFLLVTFLIPLASCSRAPKPAAPPAEHTRAELELRDDTLYLPGQETPYEGLLIENYTADLRKIEIEIHAGKAHGLSRGWYDNGQLEVEEHFENGTSHGQRTRWHNNGQLKNQAQIEHGKIVGTFTEWHPNGKKAAEVTMVAGTPNGPATSWYPSGNLKSKAVLKDGKPTTRETFPDTP